MFTMHVLNGDKIVLKVSAFKKLSLIKLHEAVKSVPIKN